MKRIGTLLALTVLATLLLGQGAPNNGSYMTPNGGTGSGSGGVTQHGSVTSGDCASWFSSGSIQDAGAACGGGGNTITLTAGTNIAAGTAVSLNSSGQAVQTWGPAPQAAGTATLFANSGGIQGAGTPGVVGLSATQFVAFQASLTGSADAGVGPGAVAFSVSGSTVTAGTPSTSGGLRNMQAAVALDGTHFVYSYLDASANLYVQVGSISGNAITLGTAVEIAAGGTPTNSLRLGFAVLSSSSFVFVYNDSGGQSWYVVSTVSGTTITEGTPSNTGLPSGSAANLKVVALSASLVVMEWEPAGIAIAAGTVSGTTITLGSTATIPPLSPFSLSATSSNIATLDATHFVVAYGLGGTLGGTEYAVAGSVSGTTVTNGTPTLVNPAWYQPPNYIAVLSASEVAFYSGALEPTFASVSGTTLTPTIGAPLPIANIPPGAPFAGSGTINPNPAPSGPTTSYVFPAIVPVGSAGVFLVDGIWNLYEATTAAVSQTVAHPGIFSYAFAPISSTQAVALLVDFANNLLARVVNFEPINNGPIGFAGSACTNGNPCSITTAGVASGFSGLTTGLTYYTVGDGTIVPVNTGGFGTVAGVATTSSTILLQRGTGH
jgi:hypothetical protein